MGQTSPLTMHLLFHQRRGGCGEESRCEDGEGVSGGCGQKGPNRVGKASDEEVLRRKKISMTVSEKDVRVSALFTFTLNFLLIFLFYPALKSASPVDDAVYSG